MPPKTKEQKEEAKIQRLTRLYQSIDDPDSEIVPRTMKSSKTIAKDAKKTAVKKVPVRKVPVRKVPVRKVSVKKVPVVRKVAVKKVAVKKDLFWQSLKK